MSNKSNKKKRRRYRSRARAWLSRRKPSKSISILTLAGAGAGAMTSLNGPAYAAILPSVQAFVTGANPDITAVGSDILRETIGIDPRYPKKFFLPTFTLGSIGGFMAHKVVSKTGVNRKIPKIMGWKIEL